jgi:hypothetical protein
MNCKECRRVWSWPNLKDNPSISLKRSGGSKKNNSRRSGRQPNTEFRTSSKEDRNAKYMDMMFGNQAIIKLSQMHE